MGWLTKLVGSDNTPASTYLDAGLEHWGNGDADEAERLWLRGLQAYERSGMADDEDLKTALGCLVFIEIQKYTRSGDLGAIKRACDYEGRQLKFMEKALDSADGRSRESLAGFYRGYAQRLRLIKQESTARSAEARADQLLA